MTKKELRTMYDKMSLSEERMTELEKRLDDCTPTASSNRFLEVPIKLILPHSGGFVNDPRKIFI